MRFFIQLCFSLTYYKQTCFYSNNSIYNSKIEQTINDMIIFQNKAAVPTFSEIVISDI